ncbi:hypothetical protein A3F32_02950 [Candidatus Roizmanbacteria bacterium RIFCSPHIGHO2_12_FULL_42_10]|uniref:Uncharacterized protein n=1 Tax=Candidatus Roizmanbacteria bacterium RIFCSPHIGHO2_12_FULL_42_10 TaxID=1802053 RepID=A0A1F7I4E6_9BACT|nr:MAG: hypothetical protein A3F32_02950 [Candidatus Roizmanbacteria bacterium RIFCSPHIGHO2_12_FULL_42_10]
MPNLKQVKQEAWKFYTKWRNEKTYSPALQSEVLIKHDGNESYRKVRVILIEDKKKNRIFYSVMDKKQKGIVKQKSATPHA